MNLKILCEIFSHDPDLRCVVDSININPTLIIRTTNTAKAEELEKLINCPAYAEQGTPRIIIINEDA